MRDVLGIKRPRYRSSNLTSHTCTTMNSYLIDCHRRQRIYTSVIALTAICASFMTVLMAQPEITSQADNAKAKI
ncbi:hypothetical protein BDR04DRAFT_1090909 [Suillus decipiens]|nr:hypothetical protein BDR04DRAFT_1090909 [Suillus decipiens]